MLVGYLENIISDRALIEHIGMRLDLLYFFGYDIDDALPWHSSSCRTCKKLPTELFESLFDRVLGLCINAGMVSGNTQAVDAAYVKANVSLDNLVVKEPSVTVKEHIKKVIQKNDSLPQNDKHTKETPELKKERGRTTAKVSGTTIQRPTRQQKGKIPEQPYPL